MKKIALAAAFGSVLLATTPVSAAVFNYSYVSSGGLASGSFTTTDTTTLVNGRNAFTVIGITGSRAGVAITGLNSSYPAPFGGSDQYLFESGDPFTRDGVGFDYSNGLSGNLYFSNVVQEYYGSTGTDRQTAPTGFTLTRQSGAVPEPATWAMMLVGFGGIGFAMRRRRSKVTTNVAYA